MFKKMENGKWKMENNGFQIFHFPLSVFRFFVFSVVKILKGKIMFLRLLIFAFILMTISSFAQTPTIDAGVSQTLAKWRVGNYSDVRYKLNLTLEKMLPTLKGAIEVSVNLKTASDVILDWRKIKAKSSFTKSQTSN